MPSFGRGGKQSNRSQQNLPLAEAWQHPYPPPRQQQQQQQQQQEQQQQHLRSVITAIPDGLGSGRGLAGAPGAASARTPPRAGSSSPAVHSSGRGEVDTGGAPIQQHLQQRQRQRQQQQRQRQPLRSSPPSPRTEGRGQPWSSENSPTAALSTNSPTIPASTPPARPPRAPYSPPDSFADQLAPSPSQKKSPPTPPGRAQPCYGSASSSVDDLTQAAHPPSPVVSLGQPHPIPPPAHPGEPKRSARRLFKNILTGATGSGRPAEHHPPSSHEKSVYDNTGAGLARRPSKRLSSPSTWHLERPEERQPAWCQQAAYSPPSPLHEDPPWRASSPVRHVLPDHDTFPYDHEESAYRQPPQAGPCLPRDRREASSPPEPVSPLVSPIVRSAQQDFRLTRKLLETSPSASRPPEMVRNTNPTPPAPAPAPPGGPGSSRKPLEDRPGRGSGVDPPAGPPPNYRHSLLSMNNTGNLSPTAAGPAGNQNYRNNPVTERQQLEGSGPEAGRSSPQLSTTERPGSESDKQLKDLLTKYKNVKKLYFDGKTQIEQLSTQVETLQNAVANQRLSQSRTTWDDNEYASHFNRLNGAINNVAFTIRKDWRTLPGWIDKYVSPDALKTGKQEMTAVGRAVITRWVVEEIFDSYFHPGLEPGLSQQLKDIEHNIRRPSHSCNSQEEFAALTAKVVSWRMATLEGLQPALQSPESNEHRAEFTKMATSNLTATLFQYLVEPPPAGVDGGASMIIELAVDIAAKLPMESRDVAVTYPLPGDSIATHIMEPEKTSLPPLADPDEADDSDKDGDKKRGAGILSMLGGGTHPASRKGSVATIATGTTATSSVAGSTLKDPSKVRFAGFVAVEVRGRQVLAKAPVWSLA